MVVEEEHMEKWKTWEHETATQGQGSIQIISLLIYFLVSGLGE